MSGRPLIRRYAPFLPVTDATPAVSLGEGDTPLIRARHLESTLSTRLTVYLKYDGANPTGSFKDRGMTLAVSKAVEEGSRGVVCASTGNTSAAAAAYAGRAGLTCLVVVPAGNIAMGKLAQAVMHGARVLSVRGNFDDALRIVREVARERGLTLVNSINPYRIAGQTTAAFEVVDALDGPPDYHALPVGNAGNITAYWRGYRTYLEARGDARRPRMLGFQAAGAAPIVDGAPVARPETLATAIRIGDPASWKGAVEARDASGGCIEKVTDEQILDAYRRLAGREGVFCEPASAASVAGLIQLDAAGRLESGARIVCTLTGHGLKDPERAVQSCPAPVEVDASLDAVVDALAHAERPA